MRISISIDERRLTQSPTARGWQSRDSNPGPQAPPSLAASEKNGRRMRGEARRELSTSGDMMGSDCPGLVLKVPCPGQALSPWDARTVGHSFHGHVRTLESLVLECVLSLSPRGTPGGEQMILCPFNRWESSVHRWEAMHPR